MSVIFPAVTGMAGDMPGRFGTALGIGRRIDKNAPFAGRRRGLSNVPREGMPAQGRGNGKAYQVAGTGGVLPAMIDTTRLCSPSRACTSCAAAMANCGLTATARTIDPGRPHVGARGAAAPLGRGAGQPGEGLGGGEHRPVPHAGHLRKPYRHRRLCHRYTYFPPTRTTISSRCQREPGFGRRLRRVRAMSGPNFTTQRRTVSSDTSTPRSVSNSWISR